MMIQKKNYISGRSIAILLMGLFVSIVMLNPPISAQQPEDKAGKNDILTIGRGMITDGNLATAKENALSQALNKSVEQYLLMRIGSWNIVNNFRKLVLEILPDSREKILNFHILLEERVDDAYLVLVRVKINKNIIDERLREVGFIEIEGPPLKILFMVSEKSGTRISHWWKDPEVYSALNRTELALHNGFQKRGFSLVNRSQGMADTDISTEMGLRELGNRQIAAWGRLFSADVVIFGQTEIVEAKEITLSYRVIDVDQGLQITQGMLAEPIELSPDAMPLTEKSLEHMVDTLAGKVSPIIIRFASEGQKKIHRLKLTLKELKSYRQFREFRDFLKREIGGVISVIQTRIRKDAITVAVEFKGTGDEFLTQVLNHEHLPLVLDLEKMDEDEIDLLVR